MTQRQSRQFALPKGYPQGALVVTKAPVPGLIGKGLVEAGELTVPGAYECEIYTSGWSDVAALLRPSAVTGTFAASLITRYVSDGATRLTTTGANFAANTDVLLAEDALEGDVKAWVTFTIPASGEITFARAEFRGWHV